MRSSQIGPGDAGGLRRLALSDADKEMRDQFVYWCREAGCSITIDQAGNIFARAEGREKLPPVAIGSHLDTQVAGGRFDGILGVLSGLEVIRTLKGNGFQSKRPIEIVNWTNEEGARFTTGMNFSGIAGSSVFAGLKSIDWLYSLTDDDNLSFGGELRRIGYAGDAQVGGHSFDSYFELHIEQGPILYEANIPVGVVVGAYPVKGMNVLFRGETAHVGPTPMNRRKNVLVGAAKFIGAVNDIGWKYAPIGKTTAASRLWVWPNKFGILPSLAELAVDMRHQEPEITNRMYTEVLESLRRCAKEANVEFEVKAEWTFGGDVIFDSDCNGCIRKAAEVLNVQTMDIYSQAGQDAYIIAQIAPTAMIFCPCVDGISHNEAENVIPEQMYPSVNVLLQAVLSRAERE
jgi:N-carbamoyl-L-amino-acid hydrolase